MSAPGGVFSSTLQSITTTKLQELAKKQRLFEGQKASLLAAASDELDPTKKLNVLLDGVSEIFAIKTGKRKRADEGNTYEPVVTGAIRDDQLETMLQTLRHFLKQATYDPSISPKLLQDWEDCLTRQLDVQSHKYRYATLYGQLAMEWLSSESSATETEIETEPQPQNEKLEDIQQEESQAREHVRAEWEKLVFEPLETDKAAIADYLQNLFGNGGANKEAAKALQALRTKVDGFDPGQFNEEVLRWTIKGLLASDLLSPEKRAVLKDFLSNSIILTEISDVLNLRLASVKTWTWDTEGVQVEMRRNVNGKYHMYIEEDILQAIFLQFIGVKFSVFFKRTFTEFSNHEGAWTSLRKFPSLDKNRRDFFLGQQSLKPSVQSKRQGIYKSIYFMSQLQDSEYKDDKSQEGEVEVDYNTHQNKSFNMMQQALPAKTQPITLQGTREEQRTQLSKIIKGSQGYAQQTQQYQPGQPPGPAAAQQMAAQQMAAQQMAKMRRMAPPRGNLEYDLLEDHEKPDSPMATKQALLHLLSTEFLVNTRFHGEFTCARSEFETWNSSLPHSTAFSVLSFFGLPAKWRSFFRSFLECPLKFTDDGETSQPRIRKRGALGAHVLSTVIGEVILFCLDYAVNQSTDGAQLYRMHDDFWVWSPSHQVVVRAWEAITQFSQVMGVTLNKGKSGTVRILRDKTQSGYINPSLPQGDIRWGFLRLDPVSGKFIIDQEMVNFHIDKLERQLQDRKSIFDWIQTWNAFAGRFFTSNFGKPANCFGQEHVNSMLKALETIQRRIFSDTSVVQYLKNTIEERFGVKDIPDGYFYFPTNLGGLELHNPFINLVQLRDAVYDDPDSALSYVKLAEDDAYRHAKHIFENGPPNNTFLYNTPKLVPEDKDQFMSFEEFTRHREEFSATHKGNICSVFEELLRQPAAQTVTLSLNDIALFNKHGMKTDYWQWIALLYKDDMINRFGSLDIVDKSLLPTSMISLYRSGRVKWQG